MTNTRQHEARRIDADVAAEWAHCTATRWLPASPVAELDKPATPAQLRGAIMETSVRVADAMKNDPASQTTRDGADRGQIDDWLRTCCDAVSEPDQNTDERRVIEAIGNLPATSAATTALRRWMAALREVTERTGVGWLRGRGTGPCAFDVVDAGGRWIVLEHGWPRNESDLQKLIVPAAAKAIARHAQSQGKHPAAEAAIAERFNADAVDYCSQAATQPPQWL